MSAVIATVDITVMARSIVVLKEKFVETIASVILVPYPATVSRANIALTENVLRIVPLVPIVSNALWAKPVAIVMTSLLANALSRALGNLVNTSTITRWANVVVLMEHVL